MESQNRYDGIDAYAVTKVRFQARQLTRTRVFRTTEVEDLEQDLMLDLLRRLPSFDPSKASRNTWRPPRTGRFIGERAGLFDFLCGEPDRRPCPSAVSFSAGRFGVIRTDSCHGGTPFMEDQTLEIVGEIGKPDLGLGPLQPDGVDEQSHAAFLMGEDMLDACTHRRFMCVGPGGRPSRVLRNPMALSAAG